MSILRQPWHTSIMLDCRSTSHVVNDWSFTWSKICLVSPGCLWPSRALHCRIVASNTIHSFKYPSIVFMLFHRYTWGAIYSVLCPVLVLLAINKCLFYAHCSCVPIFEKPCCWVTHCQMEYANMCHYLCHCLIRAKCWVI